MKKTRLAALLATVSISISISVSGSAEATISIVDYQLTGNYVGNTNIQWANPLNIDLTNAGLIDSYLDVGIAFPQIDYFTPGLSGGRPNYPGNGADTGWGNTFSVIHDWNSHNSPFSTKFGYIDILSPLFGVTHEQISNFLIGQAATIPQNNSFDSYTNSNYEAVFNASNFGTNPGNFDRNNGYSTVPNPSVLFGGGEGLFTGGKAGEMHAGSVLIAGGRALASRSNQFLLSLTNDGYLTITDTRAYYVNGNYYSKITWSTKSATKGKGGKVAIMQPDGNWVMYRSNWTRVIDTNTASNANRGAFVRMGSGGGLEILKDGRTLRKLH